MAQNTLLGIIKPKLVPASVRRRRLAIREVRNKVVLGPRALRMQRFEDSEVHRLSQQITQIPQGRVATIIPTYRRPDLLRRAVQSALAQTVRDQVVIVVDDAGGLPDLPSDPRLVAFSLSANTATAGIVRNIGIRLSRSEFVAFLDDDNKWEVHHLQAALSAFEKSSATRLPRFVYTSVVRVLPDGTIVDVLSQQFDRRLLAERSYIDTSALVVRRFPGLRFSRLHRSPDCNPIEDWEIAYRLSRKEHGEHVPVETVRYLINPRSYWSTWHSVHEGRNR